MQSLAHLGPNKTAKLGISAQNEPKPFILVKNLVSNFLEKQRRYHLSNWRFRRETVQILTHFGGPRCDVDLCGCFGTKPYFSWEKCTKTLCKSVHPQAPVFAQKCPEGSRLKRSAKTPKITIFGPKKCSVLL